MNHGLRFLLASMPREDWPVQSSARGARSLDGAICPTIAPMIRVATLVLLGGFICAVSLSASAEDRLLVPSIDATPEQVQTAAQRIVFSFAEAVNGILDQAAIAPAVEIRNTPNLAYFDHRTQAIVLAHWPTLDQASREFFLDLTDSVDDAASLFVGLFNRFLVAHEMTHWLYRTLGIERDHYASEREANDMAVAFFLGIENGEAFLLRLRQMVEAAVARLSDPTPAQAEEAQYFDSQYGLLARNPYQYGYYQFQFILDSIDRRGELDFATRLTELIAE